MIYSIFNRYYHEHFQNSTVIKSISCHNKSVNMLIYQNQHGLNAKFRLENRKKKFTDNVLNWIIYLQNVQLFSNRYATTWKKKMIGQ